MGYYEWKTEEDELILEYAMRGKRISMDEIKLINQVIPHRNFSAIYERIMKTARDRRIWCRAEKGVWDEVKKSKQAIPRITPGEISPAMEQYVQQRFASLIQEYKTKLDLAEKTAKEKDDEIAGLTTLLQQTAGIRDQVEKFWTAIYGAPPRQVDLRL